MIEILKLLPKTNCKECGFPTCMVFATVVAEGAIDSSDCPALSDENREKLADYRAAFQLNV